MGFCLSTAEELRKDGHETDTAEDMVHALEHSLQAFERHRDLIPERLKSER